MYLSRVEINPHRRETMHALASPQILHAAVEASFPASAGLKFRNIWRIDKLDKSLYILLQSQRKPDFTHIIEQFGWPASEQSWEIREYGEFLSSLQNGQIWRFKLKANPVHAVTDLSKSANPNASGKQPRGKVVAHVTIEHQKQWLSDKSSKSGFEFEKTDNGFDIFDITQSELKKFKRQGHTVTLAIAVFEGVLRVTDAKLLADNMKNGIGRAKAYGCGLMTLVGV
ncbi:MAG: type I-E CRISPR-associated protein Cas6/Cse3/CasE [Syntrophomonadaceae bacterium]|jgi:CRISPR system Cascade subunit CasE|nr:type I-E CRISPR-associated protein Cas6/Cse3/CasE [Syntrophomonadaceae bacterium]